MGLTNEGENRMLNWFRNGMSSYLALFTTAPGEEGGGTEVSGGGYERQPVLFAAPADGVMASSAPLEFPTATSAWGTAVAWGIFDAADGGTLVWSGELSAPKELLAGDIYRINTGNLRLMMD